MFCNKCGEILREGALRCPVCGAFQKKGTRINTDCDCDTNKRVTFETKRTETHSTFNPGTRNTWNQTNKTGRLQVEHLITLLKNFFLGWKDFSGRISRRDYWLTYLILVVIGPVSGLFGGALTVLWSLVILLPGIAMAVRRLNDIGRSGTHLLLGLIPIAGPIILLILLCQPGT